MYKLSQVQPPLAVCLGLMKLELWGRYSFLGLVLNKQE